MCICICMLIINRCIYLFILSFLNANLIIIFFKNIKKLLFKNKNKNLKKLKN